MAGGPTVLNPGGNGGGTLIGIHWFHPPVYIRTDRPWLTYVCTNVEGAAAQLMKWPKRGPKWKEAIDACTALIKGERTPDDVRKAFEAAAEEEGLLRSSKNVPAPAEAARQHLRGDHSHIRHRSLLSFSDV